jgi:hypothetical protein
MVHKCGDFGKRPQRVVEMGAARGSPQHLKHFFTQPAQGLANKQIEIARC